MAEQSVPTRIDDIATGPALAPEARKDARRNKTPSERIERVEERTDEQDDRLDAFGARLGSVEVTVAGFAGQMKIVPDLVETMKDATKAMREREDSVFKATVEVKTAKAVDQIKAGETEREDAADKAKTRRKLTTGIVLAIAGGAGGLVELLHYVGVLR